MIRFQFFPRSHGITPRIKSVVEVFEKQNANISSDLHKYSSNEVLQHLEKGLEKIGFSVEKSKKKNDKIHVPVLFGLDNQIDKSFNADALSEDGKVVIEVEAGRAVDNNHCLLYTSPSPRDRQKSRMPSSA